MTTTSPIVERVLARLDFADDQLDSLDLIASIEPVAERFLLPSRDDARALLTSLGIACDAVDEAVDGLPSADDDPDVWWVLERLYTDLLNHEGGGPLWWPYPVPSDDPLSRYFQLYVFLAALPHARAVHADRGVSDEISRGTLQDVALSVEWFRRRQGRPGFNSAFWMAQHFRGELYLLGRLQFNFWHVVFEPPHEAGFAKDDPCLGVHIPALGPLSPEACSESFARARAFFPEHFPERADRVATCGSWLLDEQLAEYLPGDSNIIRFQRMFTPVPDWEEPGDENVIRFVFGYVPESLDVLPQDTTLQRAAVKHIKDGRQWKIRNGWIEL